MTMTDTDPRPGDPTYEGRRRAPVHDEAFVLDAPTIAEGLSDAVRLGSAGMGMTLTLGDTVISPSESYEMPYDVEPLPVLTGRRPALASAMAMVGDLKTPALVPHDSPHAAAPYGRDPLTGQMMHRSNAPDPHGEWRTTMTGNFPSGSKKAKAKLARLPRRYHMVFGFANSIGADSFGGAELGTAFWQVLEDRTGWRGRRGLPNSIIGSNRIGNGCLWRHDVYRCLDSAHFTIHGLPSAEFGTLDMPVVLLQDKTSGAIHAEITVHNFARRYSHPGERDKVAGAIIRLVNTLTDAGIPVILRGDFNDAVDIVNDIEDHTELHKVAPSTRSIDIIFASADIDCANAQEVSKSGNRKLARTIDHGSVTVVKHRVRPDADCPRHLPRLPRIY